MPIMGIPVYGGSTKIGEAYTNEAKQVVVVLYPHVFASLEALAREGLFLGLKLEPIFSPANPIRKETNVE